MAEPASELSSLLRDVPRMWRSIIDRRLRPLGLSQAKWRVLYYAGRQADPVTQTEMADYLGIECPTLARLLDRLASDGWVRRITDPTDRRARRIELTDKARRVAREIDDVVLQVRSALMSGIDEDDLHACLRVLEQIRSTAATLKAESLADRAVRR